MRDKILAELRKKHPGLSTKILGLVADKLVKTVTEESQIEGAVSALDNMPISLKEFADFNQKDGDSRVTEALKKAKPAKEGGDNEDPEDKNDPSTGADANNPMMKLLTELTKEVKGLKQEKQQQTLNEKLQAKMKEKSLPAFLAKGRLPEKEEDLDTVVSEIEADWNEHRQSSANAEFDKTSTPISGGGKQVTSDAAAADIKAWASSGKAQAGAGAKT